MCPSISKFKDLPVVQNRAIELWNETVNYSRLNQSTHTTREFGCFIYLNTGTGEYHCGSTIPGDPIQLTAPGKGTVRFVYSEQSYDPRETFDLIVGTIHSHYPMTWAVHGLNVHLDHLKMIIIATCRGSCMIIHIQYWREVP